MVDEVVYVTCCKRFVLSPFTCLGVNSLKYRKKSRVQGLKAGTASCESWLWGSLAV